MQTVAKRSVLDVLLDRLLKKRARRFSPVLYRMHRRRIENAIEDQISGLITILILTLLQVTIALWGRWDTWPSALLGVGCLYLLVSNWFVTYALLRVRLLPYFELAVPGREIWRAGKSLLWDSRWLDELAERIGVTPLSHFISGDPSIEGERLELFEPGEALKTTRALLAVASETGMRPGTVWDLTKLREALSLCQEWETRFCLHLREGNSGSGDRTSLGTGNHL